jgi:hypothetical protein
MKRLLIVLLLLTSCATYKLPNTKVKVEKKIKVDKSKRITDDTKSTNVKSRL